MGSWVCAETGDTLLTSTVLAKCPLGAPSHSQEFGVDNITFICSLIHPVVEQHGKSSKNTEQDNYSTHSMSGGIRWDHKAVGDTEEDVMVTMTVIFRNVIRKYSPTYISLLKGLTNVLFVEQFWVHTFIEYIPHIYQIRTWEVCVHALRHIHTHTETSTITQCVRCSKK